MIWSVVTSNSDRREAIQRWRHETGVDSRVAVAVYNPAGLRMMQQRPSEAEKPKISRPDHRLAERVTVTGRSGGVAQVRWDAAPFPRHRAPGTRCRSMQGT